MRTLISRFVRYRLQRLDCTIQDSYLHCRHETLMNCVTLWLVGWLVGIAMLALVCGFATGNPGALPVFGGLEAFFLALGAVMVWDERACFISPHRMRHFLVHLLCWPIMPLVRFVDLVIAWRHYDPERWPTSQYCCDRSSPRASSSPVA